jgi:hypothetical protein
MGLWVKACTEPKTITITVGETLTRREVQQICLRHDEKALAEVLRKLADKVEEHLSL